jgi:hypothetical protein
MRILKDMKSKEHPTKIYTERVTLLQVRISDGFNMAARIEATARLQR